MLLASSFAFGGCSCGSSEQKDAVNYDNVRKNTSAAREKKETPPAVKPVPETPAPAQGRVDKPGTEPAKTDGGPVQKIINEARKNGKIDVKPAAPGCEAAREKLKKILKDFKFDRDFNDEAVASVVKELSDKTGFKFKADADLAARKMSMRSSGRKLAVFMREIERMGVSVILSPENDILLRSGENRGARGFGRGGGKRDGAERPSGDKIPAGSRPNILKNQGQPGEHKTAAPDADVFDDTDLF